ncbi:MAG: PIN domain-containing protein [Deltaproteobacteria bacterium]|nr:PIN domain-containing protein [Deltaproteobacteria bacterium]
MGHDGVIADSCAWIGYFRREASDLKETLERLLISGSVVICGVVMYELSQGLKSDKERSLVTDAMQSLRYVEMSPVLWLKAADVAGALRRRGKTVPLSDVIIAALAMEHNLAVLTVDKHFNLIENLKIINP